MVNTDRAKYTNFTQKLVLKSQIMIDQAFFHQIDKYQNDFTNPSQRIH
jgi:hypothetical protein